MSFFARIKTTIKDLDCLEKACSQHELLLDRDKLLIKDKLGRSTATIEKTDQGYGISVDNDPRYSSITSRLGPGIPGVIQSYTEHVVRKSMELQGGYVEEKRIKSDGSLVLRVAVGG